MNTSLQKRGGGHRIEIIRHNRPPSGGLFLCLPGQKRLDWRMDADRLHLLTNKNKPTFT
jgi:hypothetical protein